MTVDRRNKERVYVCLPVRWDGASGLSETRLDDISLGGCFVNTDGRVEMNEVVNIEIELPSGEEVKFQGEVASYHPGVGFGLAFKSLTEEEEAALRRVIELAR